MYHKSDVKLLVFGLVLMFGGVALLVHAINVLGEHADVFISCRAEGTDTYVCLDR